MRTAILALALLVCICAGAPADTVVLDDFEQFSPPVRSSSLRLDAWSVVYDQGKTTVTTVRETAAGLDGGASRVLLVSGEGSSCDIARKVPFRSIGQYPLLRWKWKVTRFPAGADISDLSRDDSAAQVYVNFDLKASFLFYPDLLSICYYYGSTERPGQVFLWEGYGTFVEFIRIRSVPRDGIGVWLSEERDVLRDYRQAIRDFSTHADAGMRSKFLKVYEKALGRRPAPDPADDPELGVHSVAIWVDSNDTHTRAESRYDDITFSSAPEGRSP